MADRLVHLIDPDTALAAEIASTLQGYGLSVHTFTDGNDSLAAKEVPQLIILCIDPKKLGWALCNRMKKSSALKGVPLVVTSSEATEKDFEDHKQLKNRAEEYLRKPFAMDELVQRLSPLLGGLEAEQAVDIPIEEELAIEEVGEEMMGSLEEEFSEAEPTGVINSADFLVDNVDKETEAAFDAISTVGPLPTAPPAETTEVKPLGDKEPPLPGMTQGGAQAQPAASARESAPIDLGLDEIEAQVRESSRVDKLPGPDGEVARLRAEVARLERDLEDARARSRAEGGGQFSREREFLNLREVINKKEKEVLDLKDQVDAKDRSLLDMKDKLRELDRARRDLDEKMLQVEKDLVASREKVDGLSRDKETAANREKGYKQRLDDTQKRLERAQAEAEEWKAKHASDVEAAMTAAANTAQQAEQEALTARQQFAEQRAELEHKIDEMIAQQAAMLADTRRESAEAIEGERRKHRAEVDAQAQAHAEENEQRDRAHAEAFQQRNSSHAGELQERDRAHTEEMQNLRVRHAEMLAAADQRVKEQMAKADERHRQELALAERAHAQEVERLKGEQEAAIQQLDEQHAGQIAEVRTQAAAEQGRLQTEHAAATRGIEERHATQVQSLGEDHRAEVAKLRVQASEIDAELSEAKKRIAELEAALGEATNQAAQLASDLAAARAEVTDRDGRIGEHKSHIEELEVESNKLQEQILSAYQRMRADEQVVARARKALAIALTLLDDNAAGEARKSS